MVRCRRVGGVVRVCVVVVVVLGVVVVVEAKGVVVVVLDECFHCGCPIDRCRARC